MGHRRLSVVSVLLMGALAACSGSGAGVAGGSPAGGAGSPAAAGGGVYGGGGGGGGPAGAAVPAGGDQCGMLTAGDWASVGVTDATSFTENNSPPDAFFCVYRGKSSATGGLEMDVFISPTAADAGDAFPEMFGEYLASSVHDVDVAGADKAQLHLPTAEGSGDPALIGVQKGKLTFGIGMGSSFADAAANGDRLKQLAALVLARGDALTK